MHPCDFASNAKASKYKARSTVRSYRNGKKKKKKRRRAGSTISKKECSLTHKAMGSCLTVSSACLAASCTDQVHKREYEFPFGSKSAVTIDSRRSQYERFRRISACRAERFLWCSRFNGEPREAAHVPRIARVNVHKTHDRKRQIPMKFCRDLPRVVYSINGTPAELEI